jgi:hypothetical protein
MAVIFGGLPSWLQDGATLIAYRSKPPGPPSPTPRGEHKKVEETLPKEPRRKTWEEQISDEMEEFFAEFMRRKRDEAGG